MDDLLAECIALKGFGQTNAGGAPAGAGSSVPTSNGSNTCSTTNSLTSCSSGGGDSEGVFSPPEGGREPWSPPQLRSSNFTTASTANANATPDAFPSSSSSLPSSFTSGSGIAAAVAAAAVASVASNIPDGEYPPETSSLRVIGEKFGCVIDVVGEIAADAAAVALGASAAAFSAGHVEASGVLRAVGSATPVGYQDILIWGPSGVVAEAKDAVCSLVSGRASAEVVVGAKRIEKRDRGFWVNCEVGCMIYCCCCCLYVLYGFVRVCIDVCCVRCTTVFVDAKCVSFVSEFESYMYTSWPNVRSRAGPCSCL